MKKKILVVEDDRDIADLVKLVLETEDFEVDTVLDPSLALDRALEYKPDAVLLDLTMPKMDGWQVFKMLRKRDEFKHVPIAILTAKSERFDEMVGLHVMNADAYITKPFGKQELIDKTHELLRKSAK
ncbi:MAG: response regulator transcription factor [Chitinivibrionales bacterium]